MRKLFFKIFGTRVYLRTLHTGFHFLYSIDALKKNEPYTNHYFDKYIMQKGDIIIDIGANLGYYTKLFAKWTGKAGHVYAVEPVTIFSDVIKWGTASFKNITVYNYALGAEEKEVTLSTPGNFGYLRTGLPHVVDEKQPDNYEFTFKAQMKRGSKLFGELPKINFIKCDIEGYEDIVLPEMTSLINKYKPIIQLETWGEHKPRVEQFLLGLGYKIYEIEGDKLKPSEEVVVAGTADAYFIHNDNNKVLERLKKINKA